MKYIPEQGDLVWLDFDPSSGKEIMKRRPAYIISQKAFNRHTELAIVVPITSTIRGVKLEIVLPENLETSGSILAYQIKSLDFKQRKIEFIEKAPKPTVDQIRQLVRLIVS